MRRRALVLVALMAGALVVTCGVALAATTSCPNRDGNLCVGTNNKDTMTGRDGRSDEMKGRGGPDEMKGRGGADVMLGQLGRDTLSGQQGPDRLTGGAGGDTLEGAEGNDILAGVEGKDDLAGAEGDDTLKGGDADDDYVFRINDWGDDTIIDTADTDNDPLTGNFAEFGFPNGLTTRLTIDLNSSPNSPEVSNGNLTGTVNWSNDAIDRVYINSITDDTIIGNPTANELSSDSGEDSDDTIFGGAGNDLIDVGDGAGGDTVDCGAGDDRIFFDAGDTIKDCERFNSL